MSHFGLKNESLAELKLDPNFSVKIIKFFASCTERKNESFLPKRIETLAELKFDPNF